MTLLTQTSSKWPKVRFGDVVRNVDESVRDPQTCELERYVGLEHIDPESLHIQRWGLIAEGTTFTRRFRKGQVLFGKRRAYQRKVAVAEFDGLCSSDILVFEPKDDRLLPELLPFLCQTESFFEHALDTSAGSLSPRTKFKELARFEFPLPPLYEQRRIAEIFWAADDAIQKSTALLKTLYKTKLEVIASVIEKQSKLPGTVSSTFSQIGFWTSGSTPTKANSEFWDNGEIIWITPCIND
jgi:type I restriction enzyme S subunit